jgi:hypothetical protein
MEYVLALVGGLSFALIWIGLTRPTRTITRPQAVRDQSEQARLRSLRGGRLSSFAPLVEEVGGWLRGRGVEDPTWRGGINARYLWMLKQANWYWAPGEATLPDPKARFWNLQTLWAAKVLAALLFALSGVALTGTAAMVFGWRPGLALCGVSAGVIGFFDPDSELNEVAENRRRQITLEMGYKVPELRVYVRSGRTFAAALRYLTARPGGPFVQELYRVLEIYDITADVGRGLAVVMERNRLCEPLFNLCGDLMAVVKEGGELGPVLEAHTDTAQHEQ